MRNVHRVALLFSSAALWGADGQFLKWMDRIAQEQLSQREAAVARVHTVAEAEARKQAVRAKILELIGGLPDYAGPLNAQITGRIETPRYVIEKVIFESLPKVFVTANVYRPKEPGRYPGVLMPMGHWNEGKPAAQLVYVTDNKAIGPLTLVIGASKQPDIQPTFDRRQDVNMLYWRHHGRAYALVGQTDIVAEAPTYPGAVPAFSSAIRAWVSAPACGGSSS